MNKFQLVSSDGHQMSLAGGGPGPEGPHVKDVPGLEGGGAEPGILCLGSGARAGLPMSHV